MAKGIFASAAKNLKRKRPGLPPDDYSLVALPMRNIGIRFHLS
jgi:hypothetical protein